MIKEAVSCLNKIPFWISVSIMSALIAGLLLGFGENIAGGTVGIIAILAILRCDRLLTKAIRNLKV